MAFLDNSGDIILDAVLTDTGRYRLAKGDGSFRITKFALGDDEINYKLYDKDNPSGSAYYDLEIMQTPILEAFTNNTSMLQYKLLSIPRTNLLYLPELKINSNTALDSSVVAANQGYAVAVTQATVTEMQANNPLGTFNGENWDRSAIAKIDQGLDTTEISWQYELDQDLKETQYIIEIDSRLGIIASTSDGTNATISFIDDDNIASYYLSQETDPQFIVNNKQYIGTDALWNNSTLIAAPSIATIQGPQGTTLFFSIKSTLELISSNFLFTQIGGDLDIADAAVATAWGLTGATGTYKYIDTIIKITGATTGYRLDIPVRFIKQITT